MPDEENFTLIAAMFVQKCSELKDNPIKQASYLAATLYNLKANGLHPDVDCAVSIYGVVMPDKLKDR